MSRLSYENYLRNQALELVYDNWILADCAKYLGIDTNLMCAFVAGIFPMPMKYVFDILGFFDCDIVIL